MWVVNGHHSIFRYIARLVEFGTVHKPMKRSVHAHDRERLVSCAGRGNIAPVTPLGVALAPNIFNL